jgi:hypothetical protein
MFMLVALGKSVGWSINDRWQVGVRHRSKLRAKHSPAPSPMKKTAASWLDCFIDTCPGSRESRLGLALSLHMPVPHTNMHHPFCFAGQWEALFHLGIWKLRC